MGDKWIKGSLRAKGREYEKKGGKKSEVMQRLEKKLTGVNMEGKI